MPAKPYCNALLRLLKAQQRTAHNLQHFWITSDAARASYLREVCLGGKMKKTILWAAASLSTIALFSMLPDIKRYIKISTM